MDYDICAACTFSANEITNFRDLRMQIYAGLELLPSQYNINISTLINTAPAILVIFYSLFGVISEEIWEMIKIIASYQIPGYKTLELVVKSKSIFSSNYYDPTNIPERTHS
jgi:hypothetical protein